MEQKKNLYKYGAFIDVCDPDTPNRIEARRLAQVESLLTSRTLYFARPSQLNDPFELRPFLGVEATDDELVELGIRVMLRMEEFSNEEQARLAAIEIVAKGGDMVRTAFMGGQMTAQMQQILEAESGICCLSQHRDSLVMFSHYGASHTGYCMEFERDVLLNHFQLEVPVRYTDTYPSMRKFDIPKRELAVLGFGTKSVEWEYEREIRLVSLAGVNAGFGEPGGAGTKIYPKGALKSIAIGALATSERIEYVKSCLAMRDDGPVELYKTEIANHAYRLRRVLLGSF